MEINTRSDVSDQRSPHLLRADSPGNDLAPNESRGTSLVLTVANTCKTILGAGILSLSWAFYFSTMLPGLVFTVVMALLSAHSFAMLGHCSEVTGMKSYRAMWAFAFSDDLAWVPDVVTLVFCLLSIISYLIIIGDYVPRGLDGVGIHWAPLQNRQLVILLVSALIMPLNFLRDLSFLGYTSLLGTAGTLYTCLVLVLEAVERTDEQKDWQPFELGAGIFLMLPTVTFAFNGHFNAPDIYQQLERRTSSRWLLVTAVSYGICSLVAVACAVSGYVMFGSELALKDRSNVLTAPEFKGQAQVMAAYLATALSVALGVPLYTKSARDAAEGLLLRALPRRANTFGSCARHVVLTSLCIVTTLGFSMILSDLGLVIAISGAVSASLLMFVFPSLMYLRCVSSGDSSLVHRGLPMLSIAAGAIIGVAGVTTSVLQAAGVDLKR